MYSCARILLVYKEFRRIRCQNTQHNTCMFLASYGTKIAGTKSSLGLPRCVFLQSFQTLQGSLVVCLLTVYLSHTHTRTHQACLAVVLFLVFFVLFCFCFLFLTKSCADYLMYLSYFVLFWETSV